MKKSSKSSFAVFLADRMIRRNSVSRSFRFGRYVSTIAVHTFRGGLLLVGARTANRFESLGYWWPDDASTLEDIGRAYEARVQRAFSLFSVNPAVQPITSFLTFTILSEAYASWFLLQGTSSGKARAAAAISAIRDTYAQIDDEQSLAAASLWTLGALSRKQVRVTKDAVSVAARAVSIGAALNRFSPDLTRQMMDDVAVDPAEWQRAKAAGLGLPEAPPFLSVEDLDEAIEDEVLLWQRGREPGRLPTGLVVLYGFLGWLTTARLYADGLKLVSLPDRSPY